MTLPPILRRIAFAPALALVAAACHDSGGVVGGGGTEDLVQPPDAAQPRFFYVAPTGNDAGPGDFVQPWQTIRRGLQALLPGDTLVLRGGTYIENELSIAAAGAPDAPITIRNHPGETVTIDGGFPQFRAAGNSDWDPYTPSRQIYRSRATFPGADHVYGCMNQADGGFALVPYERMGPLNSSIEDYTETQEYYCGPGVFWNPNDQRIYIRLQSSRYQDQLGQAVPSSVDPRRVPLFLCPDGEALDFQPGAAHLHFEGIRLQHCGILMDIGEGCHHLTFRSCEVIGGRYQVVLRDGVHDVVFDQTHFDGCFPDWVARSDVKRPEPGRPAHLLQGAALFLDESVELVEIRNCRFTRLFDGIDAAGTPRKLRVHHCEFTTIRDDVIELSSGGHGIEFDHNVIRTACVGISWLGNGAPPPAFRGTKYIHHNIIDTSTPQLYGRRDPGRLLPATWAGPLGDGMATGRAFGDHDTSSITGPDPWRIYHNTIVGRTDVDGQGTGASYIMAPSAPAVPHSVFNNIFVQADSTFVASRARVADGSQVFDGNLYHRPAPAPGTPLLHDYRDGTLSASFVDLAAFRASAFWSSTMAFYGPGWDAASVEGDPQLFPDYHPSQQGPAASGAVDLSWTGWPGLRAETFRGALAPR